MTQTNADRRFIVVRFDRRGERSPNYLRAFVRAGRNGLKQLAFGQRAEAHIFEERVEAEDIARRLRRRILAGDYGYRVEEVLQEPVTSP